MRGAQFRERALGALLRGAQVVLGLTLGDGVLAEHLDCTRHRADLVLGLGADHAAAEVAGGDGVHRRHDLLQRQPDRQRDDDTGNDNDGEEHQRDGADPRRDVRQRLVELVLRLQLALPHLHAQPVDRGNGRGLVGVNRGA